ncbi:MAG TPA: hypothetical protein P5081_16335 [Phycisphaerae bacterium]|nr:hypothetical protein [Phycisphaerae bacterium]HRW54440.1 hypothetical protein [Phycisphaerae bacterium]
MTMNAADTSSLFSGFPPRDLADCPYCGYTLTGLPAESACPECGFRYDSDTRVWIAKPERLPERVFVYYFRISIVSAIALLVAMLTMTFLGRVHWYWTSFTLLCIFIQFTSTFRMRRERNERPLLVVAPQGIRYRDQRFRVHDYDYADIREIEIVTFPGIADAWIIPHRGPQRKIRKVFRDRREPYDFANAVRRRIG